MAGPGGRPEPRMMSGKGRADQGVEAGTLIATVTYDDLDDKSPPADVTVLCIGYSDDTGVTMKVEKTDAGGRALFKGLDRTGATAYFLMARLPRFDGTTAVVDRLETVPPIQLDANAGVARDDVGRETRRHQAGRRRAVDDRGARRGAGRQGDGLGRGRDRGQGERAS